MRIRKIVVSALTIIIMLAFMLGTSSELLANTSGESTILVDVSTGKILRADKPDVTLAPASLTKLVTAYVVFEALARGEVDLYTRKNVPADAWASRQPTGSSVMFLGPDQKANIDELLRGLIVASGNDAAIALAYRVSGSVDGFVKRMNSTVQKLGFTKLHFVDPAGISPRNTATPRQFAQFLVQYIKKWPNALKNYHSIPTIIYPKRENLPVNAKPQGIVQYNRNSLITSYYGCDGLKTGHISSAGYHIAVTAKRNNYRLLALVMGVQAPDTTTGSRLREEKAIKLLNFGFSR